MPPCVLIRRNSRAHAQWVQMSVRRYKHGHGDNIGNTRAQGAAQPGLDRPVVWGPGPCRGNLVTCHWAGSNNNNTVCGVRSPGQRGGARPPSGDNNSHNNNNTMWSTLPAAKNASEANGDWDCGPRSAMNLGPGARSSSFPSSRSLLLIFSELELGVACRVFRSLAPSLVLTWFPE